MSTVKLVKEGNSLKLTAPYNPEMVTGANSLNGKFCKSYWRFSLHDKEKLEQLLEDVYGFREGCEDDLVDVRIHLATNCNISAVKTSIIIAGREIARAYNRDSGATLGSGITVERGSFKSAGSVDRWVTQSSNGVVFDIKGLYRLASKKMRAMYGWDANIAKVEIFEISDSTNKSKLPTDKESICKSLETNFDELTEAKEQMNALLKQIDSIMAQQKSLIQELSKH